MKQKGACARILPVMPARNMLSIAKSELASIWHACRRAQEELAKKAAEEAAAEEAARAAKEAAREAAAAAERAEAEEAAQKAAKAAQAAKEPVLETRDSDVGPPPSVEVEGSVHGSSVDVQVPAHCLPTLLCSACCHSMSLLLSLCVHK